MGDRAAPNPPGRATIGTHADGRQRPLPVPSAASSRWPPQVGTETAEKLRGQTEQLRNIDVDIMKVKSNLNRADVLIRAFVRKMMTDKIIMVRAAPTVDAKPSPSPLNPTLAPTEHHAEWFHLTPNPNA